MVHEAFDDREKTAKEAEHEKMRYTGAARRYPASRGPFPHVIPRCVAAVSPAASHSLGPLDRSLVHIHDAIWKGAE